MIRAFINRLIIWGSLGLFTLGLYNWLNDYFFSLMLRSVPALRRRLTFFDNGWLVVSLAPAPASSSARCANGSTFSEPPVPLYTKFVPMVAVRPLELEAPSPKRGFLKIEYCKEVTRSARVLQSVWSSFALPFHWDRCWFCVWHR